MNSFLRKILAATHLTQQGKLAEATAAIQHALSPAKARAHTPAEESVIEAEVVEVADEAEGEGVRALTGSSGATTAPLGGMAATVEAPADFAPGTVDPHAETAEEAPPPVDGSGRFVAGSFTGAGGTRAFKLFVPDGFEGEALPLVVMLHGCTQDPDDFAAGTRMNALAARQGFFVLYPKQAPRSNANKCWNWFSPRDQRRGAGEPALLAGMTRHVVQTHAIDRARIYVAGLSAGGAMAAILAREYPDVFAAAGVHSGLAPGAAQDVASAFAVMKAGPGGSPDLPASLLASLRPAPAAPLSGAPGAPLIVFHGDADQTVVAANGASVVAAALGGASAVATTTDGASGARSFRRTVWRPAGTGAETPSLAEHWVVRGGGHAWAGGNSAGSFTDPEGPDATREMLRFFAEHPRRRDTDRRDQTVV
ncbi:MAG: extracellular catalytic domain type 1 short-chain-length polyhydroxyalkanoate depolymerase [Caldimonas sp.]